jgi:hypothetical protein
MAPTTEEIQAQQEALAKLTEARQKDLEVLKKLDQVAKNRRTGLQREIEFYEQETKLYRTAAKDLTALLEVSKDSTNQEEVFNTLRAETIEKLEKLKELKEEGKKINEEELTQLELMKVAFDNGATSIEGMIDTMSEAADNSAHLRKVKAAAENLGTELDKTAQSILGLNNNWAEGSLTGRMLDAIGKGASLTETFSSFGSKIKETLSPANLLANAILGMVNGMKELTVGLSGQLGAFKETTSAGDEYLGTLSSTIGEVRGLGISSEQAAGAVTELYMELEMFSQMSEGAQKSLSKTVATLEAFNVSAGTSAQVADIFMQSLGHTEAEFRNLQASMLSMSGPDALGVSMSKLNSQFIEASQVIAQYSDGTKGMPQEFRKLAAAAKATRIEMSALLQIAGQFDTFEQASDRVGRLNSILGGSYFDTVQMVAATEEERIDIMRRQFQASGKTFADMKKYERLAVMNAAGITDMNDAMKLFGTSNGAYSELQELASDASMSLADLSKEAFNTLGPMQKFEAIMKKFQKPLDSVLIVLDYIASGLSFVVDGIEGAWTNAFGEAGEGFSIFITILMVGFFKLTKVFGGIIGLVGKGAATLSTTAPTIAGSITTIGTAATASAKGLLALGAAVALIGFGIGQALSGIGSLIASFKDLDADQMATALGTVAIAMLSIVGAIALLVLALPKLAAVSALAIIPLAALALTVSSIGETIAESFAAISLSLATLSDVKIPVEVNAFTENLGTLMMASKDMTPEAANATTQVMKSAAELGQAEINNDNAELIKAIAALTAASGQSTSAPTTSGGQKIELVVNLDGKEVYRRLKPRLTRDLRGAGA